jgi:peptidoglycan/LPS O-acetylase OafA/YrhL
LCLSPALVFLGSQAIPSSARQAEVFKWMGDISYPLYCVHFPVYCVASTLFDASFGVSVFSVLLSIGMAQLLHQYVEARAQKGLAYFLGARART